jgi:hypothetical protein
VEAVFKVLSRDLNFTRQNRDGAEIPLTMQDYFEIQHKMNLNLSDHEVSFDSWRSGTKIIEPFENWTHDHEPRWYEAYNHVKHDRDQNFKEASFKNLIEAIAGLFVLLYRLYEEDVFGKNQETEMYHGKNDGFIYSNDSIFSIKPP